ncbi:MAG TPA: hypothetical protein VGM09_25200 [Bradyrhizobium sp.]|jgi:hypothetical protein
MAEANAAIDYADAATGAWLGRDLYYDPGLDPGSWLAQWQNRHELGGWHRHLAYGCGHAIFRFGTKSP